MAKKKSVSKLKRIKEFLLNHKFLLILFFIFSLYLFFRFYQLEERHQFTWDQVDNAWVAKNIIIEHQYPLLGMVAKQNTGVTIGPAYYYLNALFYWIFDLDPIASPALAGLTSIFTFLVLYKIGRKLFSPNVALIAVSLYTVSFFAITADRVQWPVAFIPSVSLIIFYALYRILLGEEKYIFLLALALGFSLNIHFTSFFYLAAVLLSLPFFPRNKKILKYAFLSLPLLFIWIFPIFLSIKTNNSSGVNYSGFIKDYYHGIHLRRIIQVLPDSLVEFENWLFLPVIKFLKYIILPFFIFIFYFQKQSKERKIICFLSLLWFTIPLIVLSTFRGDLSNYYFSSTRLVSLLIFSYLVFKLMKMSFIFKAIIFSFLVYYSFINIQLFFNTKYQGLSYYKSKVYKQVKQSKGNEFTYGAPDSYLYYFYSRKLYK